MAWIYWAVTIDNPEPIIFSLLKIIKKQKIVYAKTKELFQ